MVSGSFCGEFVFQAFVAQRLTGADWMPGSGWYGFDRRQNADNGVSATVAHPEENHSSKHQVQSGQPPRNQAGLGRDPQAS